MQLPNISSMIRIAVGTLILVAVGASTQSSALAASNSMRWEGHEAALNNAVAWQQEKDGHWITFVLLTDRPVPASMLVNTSGLDPDRLSRDDEIAQRIGAQALLFAVTTGGIPMADGAVTQQISYKCYVWFHDGTETRHSALNGAGGIDIESLTADRIKGRAVHGLPADKDDMWLVTFDVPVIHGNAARMAAEGEALGKGGGQPGADLVAALNAMRKMDYASLKNYASPELAALLNDTAKRPSTLEFAQRVAGDSQEILNGLRKGDKASLYWIKKFKDPKVRNSRCTDNMVLLDGKWRSTLQSCGTE